MPDTIEQQTVDAVELGPDIAQRINRLMLATWPQIAQAKEGTVDFLLHRWTNYSGTEEHRPLYHLVYYAGELVGLAHTFARTIASCEGEMTIMGLANVCVEERERGRGYGRLVVRAAFERIQRGDFSVALFQTTSRVELFYQQLGAVTVNNRFFNSLGEDPNANPFWDPLAMRYPATAPWPKSDIDIRGPGY